MRFADIERVLDLARSDKERIVFLERIISKLRGPELRSGLIALANKYVLLRKFAKAAELFEMLGMHEDAVKAGSRI
jgi:hypothetical protein